MRCVGAAARGTTLAALVALAACANPERYQFFIPPDAIEPAAGPVELGEGVDDAPGAIMSAVIAGELLVGGQAAAAMSEEPEVMPAAGPAEDPPAGTDEDAARAERQAAFAQLTSEQRQTARRQAEQARLLEYWMRTRVQPEAMERSDIRRIQELLREQGFDPGPIDGIVGPRTRAAVEAFEEAQRLPVTGDVTPGLLDLLEVSS